MKACPNRVDLTNLFVKRFIGNVLQVDFNVVKCSPDGSFQNSSSNLGAKRK